MAMVSNLRHLECFVAVVEERSFTAAAGRLRVSQPALSRQIRELERQLGGELIERSPAGARPTAAGRALLPEARAAIDAAERAARTARQALALEGGVLELATLPSLAAGMLLPSIQRWHDDHPEISIRLREYPYRTILQESVAAGVGDLGIGTVPRAWSGPCEELGWEELVAVLPPKDPLLSSDAPVDLDALRSREWVLYDRQQGLSDIISTACAQAGFQPRPVVETAQVEAAARFAAAGLGPALVPLNNVPADLRGAVRRLKQPIAYQVAAYTRTSWSPAAQKFLEIVRPQIDCRKPRNAIVLSI